MLSDKKYLEWLKRIACQKCGYRPVFCRCLIEEEKENAVGEE